MFVILFVLCTVHLAHTTISLTPRFADGSFAEYGEHPYTVAVYKKDTDFAICSAFSVGTKRSLLCAGVIMSPQWVLSTGSCFKDVDKRFLEIEAGILILHGSQSLKQCSQVIEVILHPFMSYKHQGEPRTSIADMGLLRVKKAFLLSDFIREPHFPQAVIPKEGTLSGWGLNDDDPPSDTNNAQMSLQYANLNILPNHECSNFFRKQYGVNVLMLGENICAKPRHTESTFCQTDRGSPLVHDGNLIAILVMSVGGCRPNVDREPAVFTKISDHFWFIKKYVHDLDVFSNAKHC